MKKAEFTPQFLARFWSKAIVKDPNQCWEWTAAKCPSGYGRIKHGRETLKAHRVAWELFNAEPLGERWACHHCDNPSCVNPAHIYAGNVKTNNRDTVARGRRQIAGLSGSANPRSKLTEEDVHKIRSRIALGEGNMDIAKDFPVTHATVSLIRLGKGWAQA
jgi:hypothetical protein